jgi:thiamine biosynthesis protein ThiI
MAAISAVTAVPILRPLVGANKDEIIRLAETIGTARLSAVVDEYCAMVATRPATSSRADIVAAEEADLDPAVLERAVANRSVFDLRSLDVESRGIPELETSAIPGDAVVIDLRTGDAFAAWHWPGALHLDFDRAVAASRSMARDRRYVLYCEFGLKSAHLAESMRGDGYDASNFRGGLAALVALARAKGASHAPASHSNPTPG